MVELAIGFLFIVIAQTINLRLKPMRYTSNTRTKTYAETMTNNDFTTFNNRGKFVADRLRSNK